MFLTIQRIKLQQIGLSLSLYTYTIQQKMETADGCGRHWRLATIFTQIPHEWLCVSESGVGVNEHCLVCGRAFKSELWFALYKAEQTPVSFSFTWAYSLTENMDRKTLQLLNIGTKAQIHSVSGDIHFDLTCCHDTHCLPNKAQVVMDRLELDGKVTVSVHFVDWIITWSGHFCRDRLPLS